MTSDKPPNSRPQQKNILESIMRFFATKPQDKDDLLNILKDAHKRQLLDTEMLSMIEGILRFSVMRVKDIAIPRIQMNVVLKDAELETIIPQVVELGHSRFPVIENDRSKVVGVLLAKDLLAQAPKNKKVTVEKIMRPVSVVPESKRLNVLLKEFRTERNHLAIVIDEYGMVAGLVTIEDVLEEIVGDIEDEHDIKEETYVKKCSNKKYTVKALMPIDEFNEYFTADLQDHEHETIGGFVIHQLGHIPKKGDKLTYKNFSFEVLHTDERRLYLLKLKLLDIA